MIYRANLPERCADFAISSLHAENFFMLLVVVCRFFSKLTFSKNSFRNTIRVSDSLDPDRHSVGPDLGPDCMLRLSADDMHCR